MSAASIRALTQDAAWSSQPVLDGLGKSSFEVSDRYCRLHFWLTAGLLGLLFFLTSHDLYVSQLPDYAHYDDAVISVAVGTNLVRRIAFFLFAGLGIAFAFYSAGEKWRCSLWMALPMLGYLAWCCASVLWAVEPAMGLKRVVTLVCLYLCALGIGRRFEIWDLAWLTLVLMASFFALGLATELALGTFRPWHSGHRFAGTLHPNSQAAHLTMLCLAAFCLIPLEEKRRKWLYALVAAGLVFVVLTRSRTNIAGVLIALVAMAALRTSLRFKLIAAFACALAVCTGLLLLLVAGIDPASELMASAAMGRSEEMQTLSGRQFIWPLCWQFIAERPWLGYGYGAFWTPARIEDFLEELQFSVFEAHNGYLELRLGTGLVGCVLFVAGMVTSLIASARAALQTRDSSHALLFGVMVYAFVYANNESGMMGINLVTLLMTCLMMNLAFRPLASPAAATVRPTQ